MPPDPSTPTLASAFHFGDLSIDLELLSQKLAGHVVGFVRDNVEGTANDLATFGARIAVHTTQAMTMQEPQRSRVLRELEGQLDLLAEANRLRLEASAKNRLIEVVKLVAGVGAAILTTVVPAAAAAATGVLVGAVVKVVGGDGTVPEGDVVKLEPPHPAD